MAEKSLMRYGLRLPVHPPKNNLIISGINGINSYPYIFPDSILNSFNSIPSRIKMWLA